MSGYLNKVSLIGYLGKDPELRSFQNGGSVTTFSIATSESWKDATSGERRERTEWHYITIKNEALGKIAERCLSKGSRVYIEGQLRTRRWKSQSGEEHSTTEIHLSPFNGVLTFLDSKRDDERTSGTSGRAAAPPRVPATAGADGPSWSDGAGQDPDDEIPF